MSAAEELLAELGVVSDGSPRALEDLLLRFEARVPHEAAADAPRAPERVLSGFLADGTGSAGPERTAAVSHLAAILGFAPRILEGTRRAAGEARPHAALLFDLPGGPALADPAFPLPGLVPVGAAELASPWGRVDLEERDGSFVLAIDAAGLREEALVLARAADPAAALARAPVPPPGALVRLFDDRVVLFSGGLLTVRDAWSVLSHPLADADQVERLFGMGVEDLPAVDAPARLVVGDRTTLPRETLRARIATREGWRALQAPGLEARGEEIALLEDGILAASEAGTIATRRYAMEPSGDETRLVLETVLRSVPPRGLAEPTRKTLVFHLVSELLAWQREED